MKKIRNKINGVLLLNKPVGISSNNAIQKVKYILNAEKVGHTGTLDPMASGLLPVCLGEATKFANFLLDGDKEYIAIAQLGIVTNTGDAEGEIVARNDVNVNQSNIEKVLQQFIGNITQIPPMYSALKHEGKPLYEYARAGITIERKSRDVVIHELELVNYELETYQLKFRALVSKGTYIRTLAEDIGNALGCGASLIYLERTKSNDFCIRDSLTIDDIKDIEIAKLPILPVEILCESLRAIDITDDEYVYVKNGNQCKLSSHQLNVENNAMLKIYYKQVFQGIGEIILDSNTIYLHPKRMISNQ
jgi:tRNA pseudouridine55 synthase